MELKSEKYKHQSKGLSFEICISKAYNSTLYSYEH